ncbi:hypothetical protein AWENTII_009451 [Aspergillus wentii]
MSSNPVSFRDTSGSDLQVGINHGSILYQKYPDPFDLDEYAFHNDAFDRNYVPHTCDWLRDTHEYQQWAASMQQTAGLWKDVSLVGYNIATINVRDININAYFIRTRAIQHLSIRSDIHLLYFYIAIDGPKDERSLLLTFLKQLKKQGKLNPIPGKFRVDSKLEDLREYVWSYIQNEATSPVYIIIDGLDEYDREDRTNLISTLIARCKSRRCLFKILISSRNTDDLPRVRQEEGRRTGIYTVQAGRQNTARDIRRFVVSQLDIMYREQPRHPLKCREVILDKLTGNAKGMFLWVSLQMKALRREDPTQLERSVKNLVYPKDMSGYYSNILGEINANSNNGKIARKVLTLLIDVRPISVTTMSEAAAICIAEKDGNNEKKTMDQKKQEKQDMAAMFDQEHEKLRNDPDSIVRMCKDLVVIDQGWNAFRFVHGSVLEFLNTHPDHLTNMAWQETSSSSLLAQMCLSYICLRGSGQPSHKDLRFSNVGSAGKEGTQSFLHLASTCWPHYARACMVDSKTALQIQPLLLNLCENRDIMLHSFRILLSSQHMNFVDDLSQTHIISYLGLFNYLDNLKARSLLESNARDSKGYTPMHWAVHGDHNTAQTIRALIQHGADICAQDNNGHIPLFYASQRGDIESVQLILETQNRKSRSFRKQLGLCVIEASYQSHAAVVRELIKHGADVTVTNHLGTALHATASQGSYDCAEEILKSRRPRSLDVLNGPIGTPLHEAAFYGRASIVKMLLAKGFSIHRKSKQYGSPLQAAASGCFLGRDSTPFKEMFQLLLERGADVNAHGGRFATALHATAFYGHVDLAEMLVEKGADINSKAHLGTPFQAAQVGESQEMMDFLREQGADTTPLAPAEVSKMASILRQNYGHDATPGNRGILRVALDAPVKMLMDSIKRGNEERFDHFVSLYLGGFKTAINVRQMALIRSLASVGEEVFKQTAFLTVDLDYQHSPDRDASQISCCALIIITFLKPLAMASRTANQRLRYTKPKEMISNTESTPRPVQRTSTQDVRRTRFAFKALDRVADVAISILAHAIENKDDEITRLVSIAWTDALYSVQRAAGEDLIRTLLDLRLKELEASLSTNQIETAQMLGRSSVQMLSIAIENRAQYTSFVKLFAHFCSSAFRYIEQLGVSSDRDCLGQMLVATFPWIISSVYEDEDVERYTVVVGELTPHMVRDGYESMLGTLTDKYVNMLRVAFGQRHPDHGAFLVRDPVSFLHDSRCVYVYTFG